MNEGKKIELNKELISLWLSKLDFLNEEEKYFIETISSKYYDNNVQQLYKFNEALYNNEESHIDSNTGFSFQKINADYIITFENKKITVEKKQFIKILHGLIDILEDILPLGSVVRLKKKYLNKLVENNEIDSADVVIVNRFSIPDNINAYYHYTAIVYPLGFIGEARGINFTSNLIEEVIYKGFSDEREDTYIYLMKKELLIENAMTSFCFSNENANGDD